MDTSSARVSFVSNQKHVFQTCLSPGTMIPSNAGISSPERGEILPMCSKDYMLANPALLYSEPNATPAERTEFWQALHPLVSRTPNPVPTFSRWLSA